MYTKVTLSGTSNGYKNCVWEKTCHWSNVNVMFVQTLLRVFAMSQYYVAKKCYCNSIFGPTSLKRTVLKSNKKVEKFKKFFMARQKYKSDPRFMNLDGQIKVALEPRIWNEVGLVVMKINDQPILSRILFDLCRWGLEWCQHLCEC